METKSSVTSQIDAAVFDASGASTDLIKQATDSTVEINSRRPLPPSLLERLERDILYDRVHSSAVTEGNRLSRRETIVVLSTGVVESGTRRDVTEVRNLASAILEMEKALRDGTPLTSHFVRYLHSTVMSDLDDSAGAFRDEDVAVSGAKVQPPSFKDVHGLMSEVLSSSRLEDQTRHPIQRAAWLHWAVARIHPFRDGNGRVARLLQDYVLLKNAYVPAPLQSEDREKGYYDALESADLGDGRSMVELVAKNVIRTADRYLSIIRDDEARTNWIAGIAKAATEKIRQTNHRRFLGVQRASSSLKTELYNLAMEVSQRVPAIEIGFKDYGSLDFEKYTEIETKGRAKRTWYFGLEFRIGETQIRYIFWFGSHYRRPSDPFDSPPSNVVLLVSGEEGRDYYRLLDDLEEDRVTLRELIPSGGYFIRRRFNPVSEQVEWDTEVTVGMIARDFIEEVLGKLGAV